MDDSEEQKRLQELYDAVYDQARVWFQNLKIRFHNQILQHFGPMPEREAEIQVVDLAQSISLQGWIQFNLFWSKIIMWNYILHICIVIVQADTLI